MKSLTMNAILSKRSSATRVVQPKEHQAGIWDNECLIFTFEQTALCSKKQIT